jgi:acyl dehydratase
MTALAQFELGRQGCAYTERDAILFALAVGARPEELRWVLERGLSVMPTFAMTLGLWAVRAAGAIGAYDPVSTLHVGQSLTLHRALPPAGRVELEGHIGTVLDKGSAALIDVCVSCEWFDAAYTIFIPGAGGFGGDRGSRAPRPALPEYPDHRASVQTWPGQAALYRLTGDLHPVHIDPEVAAANGFPRPILHGLCTLAAVVKATAEATASDLANLRELTCRLTAPVLPGDTVDVEIWDVADRHSLLARAGESTVLDGSATFRDA